MHLTVENGLLRNQELSRRDARHVGEEPPAHRQPHAVELELLHAREVCLRVPVGPVRAQAGAQTEAGALEGEGGLVDDAAGRTPRDEVGQDPPLQNKQPFRYINIPFGEVLM